MDWPRSIQKFMSWQSCDHRIFKHSELGAESLTAFYSGDHIKNDLFHLLDYVQAHFENSW